MGASRTKNGVESRRPTRPTVGPLSDDATLVWVLLGLLSLIGLLLVRLSRQQPFPEPSFRYGATLLVIAALLAMGTAAPRPLGVDGLLALLSVLGAFGVLAGLTHIVRTRRDVIVAPLSGFLLCVGIGGLMARTWSSLSTAEQWVDFLALVLLGIGQTYLVFRGLLIGKLPLAWSQAGMVALQRGALSGERGAIACFERGWATDEPHLNPMAYLALQRIHAALDQPQQAGEWEASLVSSGGEGAVAPAWIEAVESAILHVVPDARQRWPNREEA